MFKDFVFKKQLSFRNSCFIFAAVTIFVYRYNRMTVSIRIGCPLYRYCIDTDCIVPALLKMMSDALANAVKHVMSNTQVVCACSLQHMHKQFSLLIGPNNIVRYDII